MLGFFLSFVYKCIAVGDPVIKRGGGGIPLTGLTPPYACVCPNVPSKEGLYLQRHMSWWFCVPLRWAVIVRLFNFGVIDYHYCLSLFFITGRMRPKTTCYLMNNCSCNSIILSGRIGHRRCKHRGLLK